MADGSGSAQVLVERAGAVATITLNRPDRGNALTTQLKSELLDAVTQAGGSFCVGQDLAEHAEALRRDPASAFDTIDEHYAPIVTALATMPKPTLAAINGTCVGAGLGLALACDLRLAADGTKLATAFSGIGLTCDSGLSATLVRAVGAAHAAELILLGDSFTAEQAAGWGLVSRVVPAAELTAAAGELAGRLAAGPTLAYAESKRLIAAAVSPPLADTLRAEADAQARLGLSADHRAAVESFLAKQRPTFDGR